MISATVLLTRKQYAILQKFFTCGAVGVVAIDTDHFSAN
jgi:hypothetical protein